ncbi:DUF4902 domain-containing protein [Pseudomonas sp. JZ134]|uniref:DUF4902 domain-containing protein n=1 Tax=Pseudomonas sp. JZ134 TaxID=2806615 RepID=UPI003DA0EB73
MVDLGILSSHPKGAAMSLLAPDHFIRMSYKEFSDVTFYQYMAWMDMDLVEELQSLGIDAASAGFCEWASTTHSPSISIGWTWFRQSSIGSPYLAPGGISTNLMLRCATGYDLGPRATEELLISWLSRQNWQSGIPVTL